MREAFQEILLRFSLCGLAASLALLALRARSFRAACETLLGLWRRMTALGRTVTVLFVSVFVVYASTKTNTPPLRIMRPSSLPRLESPTVTAADIDRGYRQVSVTTNEDASFAMPSNATIIGNWHKRGTFGEWMRLDLGDFAFPVGTNDAVYSAFAVFSDGKIRATPRDTAHEICAVGSPLLALQGESQFWTDEGADGAKLLTWENFFLNADTNAPVSAQIRLYPNGDFAVRSNEVETAYARVCPQDWDGDGRANEIDPDPFVCDGDWFGVANAIPAGGNTNAYYWLDISVTGRLDCAAIRVTCDGPSDLGNQVIIARTGQTCHVPLLAGASYTVDCSLPIASVAASSAHAEVWTNSATSLVVELPLELSFARSDAAGGSFAYIAHTSPVDVAPLLVSVSGGCCSCLASGSGFSWNCTDGCACGGYEHALVCAVMCEGYCRAMQAFASCVCQERKKTNPALWFSLTAPDVVFVNATNHPSVLAVAFDPPAATNGMLTLRCAQGGGHVRLCQPPGIPVALPCQWNAEMFAGALFSVEGVTASSTANDVAFQLEYDEPESGLHCITQMLTVARVSCVHMTSPVAGTSANPPPFVGETLCPFSVTNSLNPDRHLLVPFCNVADANDNFRVSDFSVDMRVDLVPQNTPTSQVRAFWSILDETPPSGALQTNGSLVAHYLNPKVGGIYRFSVSCNGSPTTEMNLVLPLAGASVDRIVADDLVHADNTVSFLDARYNRFRRQLPDFGLEWFNKIGRASCRERV